MRYVPAACPMRTIPASMASPPVDVTSRACSAAARACVRVCSFAMSRYDTTEVISHAVNNVIRSSARTIPSIAPPKRVSRPASRPRPGSSGSK
jgi:hypothetical protein